MLFFVIVFVICIMVDKKIESYGNYKVVGLDY